LLPGNHAAGTSIAKTLTPWSETTVTNGTGSEIEFRQLATTAEMFRVNLELVPLE